MAIVFWGVLCSLALAEGRVPGLAAQRVLNDIAGIAAQLNANNDWPINQPQIHQPTTDLDLLYALMARSTTGYAEKLELANKSTGGQLIIPRDNQGRIALKGRSRVSEIMDSTHSTPDHFFDISRATLILGFDHIPQAVEEIKKIFGPENILGAVDHVNHPLDGYRGDLGLLIRDPKTGTVHELLLMPPEIWQAREHGGHLIFEHNRELKARLKIENRPPTTEERKQIAKWNEETANLYEQATYSALRHLPCQGSLGDLSPRTGLDR